jgi:hypothetical protein
MTAHEAQRDPIAIGLRAAAGVGMLEAFGPRAGGGPRDATGERLASSAALYLAATRPGLRVGALLSATLVHLTHAASLVRQGRGCRVVTELTTSALLVHLLHEESRARQWES